ncbi:MAG: murein biosynthesis integral membrane protein MurJ [Alphaproteobacteria bacterium]|nr:murein biosynthesis integral membrane protein MurJ [Alphaproteobacteria bacterium]
MLRGIVTIGIWTMASRVLGFVRDILIASRLGAGPVADAFFVALKLPNFFRRLFGEGAFNAAFVPLFAGKLAAEGREAARAFAEQSLAALLSILAALTLAAILFMPALMRVLAPGFAADPAQFALTVELTRITFPYLMLVSLAALLSGVLNSLDRYAAAAGTPILFNLCLIAGLLWLTPHVATGGHALAWGVAAAGIAQFAWLAAASARAGFALRLPAPRFSPELRLLLVRMAPGAVGAGVTQVNLMIDVIIASLLPSGSVSVLYYADRIAQLPLGVIGAAVGTALLPTLARQIRSGDGPAAADSQNRAIEFSLFLTLPAAAALLAIAGPIVAVLFERGAFGPEAAGATAAALMAYAVGLPAFVLIKALAPGFFARGDTATPVRIAIIAVVLNLLFNLSLAVYGPFAHVGVAMSTMLAAWANVALLAWKLHALGGLGVDARLARRAPRMLAASAIMAGLLVGGAHLLAPLLDDRGVRWVALAGLVAGGGAAYGLAGQALGGFDLREVGRMLRRRNGGNGKAARAPTGADFN